MLLDAWGSGGLIWVRGALGGIFWVALFGDLVFFKSCELLNRGGRGCVVVRVGVTARYGSC